MANQVHSHLGVIPLRGRQAPTARWVRVHAHPTASVHAGHQASSHAVQGRALASALTIVAAPQAPAASTGSVSGTVTDKTSGSPIQYACVTAYGDTFQSDAVCTDSSGHYSITGLPPGQYWVWVEDHVASHISTGSTRTVAAGTDTPNVNLALQQGGSIAGTVTDSHGNPLSGVCAEINDSSAGGCTNSSGTYQTTGLAPGTYSVYFYDNNGPYVGQSYSGTVSITLGQITQNINVTLERGGTISGTLTSPTSNPVAGVCGDVRSSTDRWAGAVICSDAQGHYSTTGLQTGSYKVEFYDRTGTYLTQWYPSSSTETDATAVAVTLGQDTSGKDAVLALAGHIAGTVVSATDGAPLASVCIDASSSNGGGYGCSDSSGHFDVGGLDTGSYSLDYYDNSTAGYLERYYHDVDIAPGARLGVTRGQTTTADDEHLVLGGRISGRVVDEGGNPISGVYVETTNYDGTGANTATDGTYTVVGLHAGSYGLDFNDYDGSGYLGRLYHDVDLGGASDTISVSLSATSAALDEHLVLGGSISGTVTSAVGSNPLSNIDVEVDDANGTVGYTQTDDTGHYSYRRLTTGSYTVGFETNGGDWLAQWYDGKTDQDSADPVAVTVRQDTPGIDAALHKLGVISGTVTDASTNAPISGVCVDARDNASGYGEDCTGSDGSYLITGLSIGDYTLTFDGQYQGYVLATSASTVHAAVDTITSGINQQLTAGGTMTGAIQDDAGHSIAGACAEAMDANGKPLGGSHCDDGVTTYSITGLAAGSYTVHFYADGYVDQYYDHVSSAADATPVVVTLGATTASINATLIEGGHITGHITDATTRTTPVDPTSIELRVYDTSGNYLRTGYVDGTGYYDVTGLNTGSYLVQFSDDSGYYLDQWWDHAQTQAAAAPVAVTAGQTTPNIDAAMSNGGSISGHVTESSGQPLGDICVNVFSPTDTYNSVGYGCTDISGTYHVTGLATGTYLVEFVPLAGPYLPQWANGKSDAASADFVQVTIGNDTGGVDATLAHGATISGTVTDAVTHAALPDVCVDVVAAGEDYPHVPSTCTDDQGHYETVGLPVGTYTVQFSPMNDVYVSQWWNGAKRSTADSITLTDQQARSGIDAALAQGGRVTGTVKDSNGSTVDSWVDFYDAATDTLVDTAYAYEGSYTGPTLPAGTYKVWFGKDDVGALADQQWWNNQPDFAHADTVTVTVGQTVSGINAVFQVPAPFTGAITGKVVDQQSGQPVVGVCAYAASTGSSGGSGGVGCTDDNGVYTIPNLGTGTYTIDVSGNQSPYISGFYSTSGNPGTPAAVSVTDGSTTSGIDIALQRGATLSGFVTDAANGTPLNNICVTIVQAADTADFACTDSSGHYRSSGLAGGDYQLEFENYGGRYLSQWYGGATTQAGSQPVTLTTGQDKTGINAAMTLGAAISGSVTDAATNAGVSGICVRFHDASTGAVSSYGGCTDSAGHYSAVVPGGSYKVEFLDNSGRYTNQWWNNKPDAASADTVTVVAGDVRSGIGAALSAPNGTTGSVIGAVSDGSSNPVGNATLNLCATAMNACTSTMTDQAGGYSFVGKPAGSYDLTVYPPSGSSLTWGHATVSVTAGQQTVQDLTLSAPKPLAASSGVTVNSATSGTPTVFWTENTALTADGCTGGTATWSVTDASGSIVKSGTLTESGTTGHYTGSMPALYPNRGSMTVAILISCPNAVDDANASFTMYIDPSGTVSDTHGNPLTGVTMTLLQSSAQNGAYTAVPNGSDVMSPANRNNPDVTDATGHYGWDVVSGWYKVTAAMADCYAPNSYNASSNSVTSVVTSAAQQIPPAVTDLNLTLNCDDIAPVASFTQSRTSGQKGVSVHFDATGSKDANGNVASYSWDFGDGTTGTGATVDHTYSGIGSFTPTLTVTDDQGLPSTVKTGQAIAIGDVPGAVTGLTATPGTHSVSLSWTAPTDGGAVADYVVTVTPGGKQLTVQSPAAVVTGLTGNAAYTFSVAAENAYGAGPAATTNAVAGATGTKPTVTITAAPTGATTSRAGSVAFTVATDPSVSLSGVTCSLDGATATTCTSPYAYSGLADGMHAVVVTARDSDGNTGSASAQWSVGDVPGQVAGITATTGTHSVALSWSAPAAHNSAITGYVIDVSPGGKHLTTPTNSAQVTGLTGNTSYTFSIAAVNGFGTGAAGTTSAVAGATGNLPKVVIDSAPTGYVNQRAASVAYTVSVDPSVTVGDVTCTVDGGPPTRCTSPVSLSGLSDGSHTVVVTAHDTDGNASSASAQWVVDATAPTASMRAPTAATTLRPAFPVSWTGSDANGVTSYDVRYTKAAWNTAPSAPVLWKSATAATSAAFTGTAGNEYCFVTRARDGAGNVGAWSAARCTAIPLDDRALAASSGWKKVAASPAYGHTLMQAKASGKTLTRKGAGAGRAVLYVATGKGYGSLVVLYNGKVVKKLSLAATQTHYNVAVLLPKISKNNTTVVIKTTSAKTTQIDGLLLARV